MREALEEHAVQGELLVILDGERAIRYIESLEASGGSCPSLVILDLNLPRRPGREVLQAIRASAVCRDARVIILSSSNADQDRQDAARLGATEYICKPLRLEQFLALGAKFKSLLESA